MLNRRHIRIKVMQSVYALLQSKSDDIVREEKFLYFSISKLYELYILQLSLLIEVQHLAYKRVAISKKNHITATGSQQGVANFANNKFIEILKNSDSLSNYQALKNINNWQDATEYVQIVFDTIKDNALFEAYNNIEAPTFQEDKALVIAIFKKIIAPNDKLSDYYEDQYIGWIDDIPFVNTAIVKTLSKLNTSSTFILSDLYKDEDDRNFVKELFQKVVLNHSKLDKIIDDKTPNWDYERIADIDLILIKMAIMEFLEFPSIPTKVSINEYLEIAKDYSSDKSSFFINGVLDKIEKEYQKDRKITKIGRGLL